LSFIFNELPEGTPATANFKVELFTKVHFLNVCRGKNTKKNQKKANATEYQNVSKSLAGCWKVGLRQPNFPTSVGVGNVIKEIRCWFVPVEPCRGTVLQGKNVVAQTKTSRKLKTFGKFIK